MGSAKIQTPAGQQSGDSLEGQLRAQTEAIWQTIPGAQPLVRIYGYWPTMHDAIIREINVGFAEKTLKIVLDYTDLITDTKNSEVTTRITMLWRGVMDSKLRYSDPMLYGVGFSSKNGIIETLFDDYEWGTDGCIRSERVEVLHFERLSDASELHTNDAGCHNILISFD